MSKYDAIVVGAGILGLSTAFHIKKMRPRDNVLVIDKMSGPGCGNTSKSWACFRNFFSSSTNVALAGTSIEFYKYVQEKLGTDLQMDKIGYLFLLNREDYRKRERVLRDVAKRGVEYHIYEGDDLARKFNMILKPRSEGSQLIGLVDIDLGLMIPNAGSMDSDFLVKFYESEFLRLGGNIQYTTLVNKIIVAPRKPLGFPNEPYFWQEGRVDGVETDKGFLRTSKTIIAAGAWASELLDPIGIDCHAKPEKKHEFVVGADTPILQALLRTPGLNSKNIMPYVIIDCIPRIGASCHILPKPRENSFWLAGISEFFRQFKLENSPNPDKRIFECGINWIVPEYFPQFTGARMKNSWSAQYELNTFDGQPVVFQMNDLIVVGSASGSGVMKADAIGRIAASLYSDEEYAGLYGGQKFKVSDLGLKQRKVEYEELVL
jgi:glycine/D-amino acid oxidase-like deaminating enzyme